MKQTTKAGRSYRLLRRGILVLLGLLVIQFTFGMILNLYIKLPKVHPGTSGSYAPSISWALSGGAGIALAIHIATWLLLMLGGIVLLARVIIAKSKVFIIGTSFGLFFILVAASGGLSFLNRGGTNEQSLEMALAFICSFMAYAITYYRTRDN